VLLLDEPLSALDAKVRTELRDEIRRIQLEVGITTLFVTHDQEEALSIADRVGVMENGRLLQCDTPAAVYSAPASIFVAEFVGTVNRLRGVIGQGAVVEVAGTRLPLPGNAETASPGTVVDVLVRPEAVQVVALETGEAVVGGRSFLGPLVRVEARLPNGERVVAAMFGADVEAMLPGARVTLTLSGAPLLITTPRDPK
jgi:putative spermidine/putrescine transport system ATP-binding protein